MIDPQERITWFKAYLKEALRFPEARRNIQATRAWAKSMALIAEQHAPNDGDDVELVE